MYTNIPYLNSLYICDMLMLILASQFKMNKNMFCRYNLRQSASIEKFSQIGFDSVLKCEWTVWLHDPVQCLIRVNHRLVLEIGTHEIPGVNEKRILKEGGEI